MTAVLPGIADADDAARDGGAVPTGLSRHLSLAGLVAIGLVVWGVKMGMQPLHDNSFFTHLATGRLILDHGIPRTDPYSFTAHGDPWTVQSWLASVVYASIERTIGLHGIQLLLTAFTVGLSLAVWRLTRPAGSLVTRILLATFALGVGAGLWVERPLMFGLAGVAVLLLAVEQRWDPRWLVPVMWVWVNTHGTFPLGLALLAVLAVGRWFDRERPERELRCLAWATAGVGLGAVNPLGPKLLTFPLELLHRTEAFKVIVEWQPPTWQGWPEKFFALQLAVAALLLLRRRSWRAALPLVVFGAAALTSARNIPVASLAILPGMACAAVGLGSIDGSLRRRAFDAGGALLLALALVLVGAGVMRSPTDLADYPTTTAAWMRDHHMLDLNDRVFTRDFVGNYLEARFGPTRVRTFIDDRVDMYPLSVVRDYISVTRANAGWEQVLRRYHPSAVLWDTDSALARALQRSSSWRIVHRDRGWLVAVPA